MLCDCMFLIVTGLINWLLRTMPHKCINFILFPNLSLHMSHLLILNGNMLWAIFICLPPIMKKHEINENNILRYILFFNVCSRSKFSVTLIKTNLCSLSWLWINSCLFWFGKASWINSYKSRHNFGIGEMQCTVPLLRTTDIYF